MSGHAGPKISDINGLVFYVDAANQKSYPGSGNTWYDLSGYKNNGTIYGSPTLVSGGLNFAGSQYVMVPHNAVLNTTTPTIVVICDIGTGTPMAKGAYGVHWNYGLAVPAATANYARNNNGDLISGILPSASGPQIYTITWDGAKCNFFRSGVSAGTNATGYSPQAGTSYLIIGAAGSGATPTIVEYYTGKIYAVMVFNRALSTDEVSQVFYAFRGRFQL